MDKVIEFFADYNRQLEFVLDKSKKKINVKIKGSNGFLFHGWITSGQWEDFLKDYKKNPKNAICCCSFVRKRGIMLRNIAPVKVASSTRGNANNKKPVTAGVVKTPEIEKTVKNNQKGVFVVRKKAEVKKASPVKKTTPKKGAKKK